MASNQMPLTVERAFVDLVADRAVYRSLFYASLLWPLATLVLHADQAKAANRSGYPRLGKSNRIRIISGAEILGPAEVRVLTILISSE